MSCTPLSYLTYSNTADETSGSVLRHPIVPSTIVISGRCVLQVDRASVLTTACTVLRHQHHDFTTRDSFYQICRICWQPLRLTYDQQQALEMPSCSR